MPNSAPLLTFAIPTYNRAKLLDRLLGCIEPQLRDETRVELLVSDNASPDETSAVVDAYRTRGLRLRSIRNDTNIGPDRNILQCFEQASGKYVWIFSDDDLLAPDALARVLAALSRNEYDIVSVGAYFFRGDYVRHRSFKPSSDIEFTSAVGFARHVHVLFTFISGIIVNKERISSVAHPPFASLFDTNLAQLGPYFTALGYQRRSLLIRDPLIAATGNTNVGYTMYKVFGHTLATIANEWIGDRAVREAITNGALRAFFPSWILQTRQNQEQNLDTLEDPHGVLRSCFGQNYRYWIFDFPVYALPLPFARLWLIAVKLVNKLNLLLMSFRGAASQRLVRQPSVRKASRFVRANSLGLFFSELASRAGILFRRLMFRRLGAAGLVIGPRCHIRGLSHISLGSNFRAAEGLWLEALPFYGDQTFNPRIVIGDCVSISRWTHITCIERIEIGAHTLIGSKVLIADHNHGCYRGLSQSAPAVPPAERQLGGGGSVLIGKNVWIGDNVTILGPAKIGDGAVIASNSVVTSDVCPNTIAGGIPARPLKHFDPSSSTWSSA